jgi:hypothetical protein
MMKFSTYRLLTISGIGLTASNEVYMISNHGEQWDKVDSFQPDQNLVIRWNNFEDPSGATPKQVCLVLFTCRLPF